MVVDPAADLLGLVDDGWILTSREVERATGMVRFYFRHVPSGERCRVNVPVERWRTSPSLMLFELAVA